MRANDVIYMEEADGDPGRATHSVNDTDTLDSASRPGVFPAWADGAMPCEKMLAANGRRTLTGNLTVAPKRHQD